MNVHFQAEPPSAYIECAPRQYRGLIRGIAETETAGTGDPLQLVDTSTLKVYRTPNPGAALALIHALEKQGHSVSVGAFGLKTSNYKGWHIRAINALNPCFSANFAAGLLRKNEEWAWGRGYRGAEATDLALAAYTTGKLSMRFGGQAYVDTVLYYSRGKA